MVEEMKQAEGKPGLIQRCTAPNPFIGLAVAIVVIALAVVAWQLLAAQ